MIKRGSGILMHITSLPSRFGIGDFGPEAYRFADFLAETKQSCWQILPLTPTDPMHGNSPYSSASSSAISPWMLSPELMVEGGYLKESDLNSMPDFDQDKVDFGAVAEYKKALLDKAYKHFKENSHRTDFTFFCRDHAYWLDDFALFMILKRDFGGKAWNQWPVEYRDRHQDTMEKAKADHEENIQREKFIQYLCYKQWFALREYCNDRGIQLFGDIPIYVNYDSVDVWSNPQIFKLNDDKTPTFVAGVPPDYFSETGQLWGNPVYNWDVLGDSGYEWWIRRLRHNFRQFDIIRIDHFRGLVAYWEVPNGEETAINGKWVTVPVDDFFNAMLKHFFLPPIVAEDLGMITAEVRETLKKYTLPGMKILMFGFGADDPNHPYLPHNYEKNYVAYTATHDNNTVRGWFEGETNPEIRKRLFMYIGREVSSQELPWEMIRLVMASRAALTIFPMQDILCLGGETRMNRPAHGNGNWNWRMRGDSISPDVKDKLAEFTYIYNRV
ncbi:MAG: 4-alpha-glucanotransferase [candidate division Zixibacteria bacterium]|nr:4-alpha-glucanotransferase [candidate division Zixibacteria bacterium]